MNKNDNVEELDEANKSWSLIKGSQPQLCRFFGKTFPCILLGKDEKGTPTLFARDDNGDKVSKTYETQDIDQTGVNYLLKYISAPHPTASDIESFLELCNL